MSFFSLLPLPRQELGTGAQGPWGTWGPQVMGTGGVRTALLQSCQLGSFRWCLTEPGTLPRNHIWVALLRLLSLCLQERLVLQRLGFGCCRGWKIAHTEGEVSEGSRECVCVINPGPFFFHFPGMAISRGIHNHGSVPVCAAALLQSSKVVKIWKVALRFYCRAVLKQLPWAFLCRDGGFQET